MTARKGFGLGDIVLLTALARDLVETYPDRFDLEVNTNFRPAWFNNPYVRQAADSHIVTTKKVVHINYTHGIRRSQQGEKLHFINAFHDDFSRQTGIKVQPLKPHGDLHLTEEEKANRKIAYPYWLILAGGKNDMTVKHWAKEKYQRTVDYLLVHNIRCVQAGSDERRHLHIPLHNCLSMVGKTPDMRQFFSLIYHAEGVICGITSAMHIAACFNKPAVIIAGGREEPWFSGYTNAYKSLYGPQCLPIHIEHRYLHTLSLLSCCDRRGCWKKRTVPLDPSDQTPKGRRFLCVDRIGDQPRCLSLIEPEHVVDAVLSYYQDNTLQKPEALPRIALPTVQSKSTPTSEARFSPAIIECSQVTTHQAHELTRPRVALKQVKHAVYDNPIIGGKFTVFVLCYGNHTDLARRCIDGILNTVPIDRVDIRVACNAVAESTIDYLRQQPISVVYKFDENRYKYPVMREIFRDRTNPIETNYMVWFDDDSQVVKPDWLSLLGQTIINNHPHGGRLYGWRHYHDTLMFRKPTYPGFYPGFEPRQWFWDSPDYPNRNFKVPNTERFAPNAGAIWFVVGGFWALHVPLIQELNIPDPRLIHNGGDIAIGAALQQARNEYRIINFNQNKNVVASSNAPRRGRNDDFPWNPRGRSEFIQS